MFFYSVLYRISRCWIKTETSIFVLKINKIAFIPSFFMKVILVVTFFTSWLILEWKRFITKHCYNLIVWNVKLWWVVCWTVWLQSLGNHCEVEFASLMKRTTAIKILRDIDKRANHVYLQPHSNGNESHRIT